MVEQPTVGEKLCYFPSDDDIYYARIEGYKGKFLTAIVADVTDAADSLRLNLMVIDRLGHSQARQLVPFVHPGDELPNTKRYAYCAWPVIKK